MSWLGRDDGLGPRALKVASGTTLAILMSHEKTIVPTVAVTLGAATLKALDRATVEIDHGATKKDR